MIFHGGDTDLIRIHTPRPCDRCGAPTMNDGEYVVEKRGSELFIQAAYCRNHKTTQEAIGPGPSDPRQTRRTRRPTTSSPNSPTNRS